MKRVFLVIFAFLCLSQSIANAQNELSLASDADSKEWVVVLDDPRPKRLQGWQRTGYRGSSNYRSAVELKRFGGRLAKDYNLALKDQWLIESLGVYCLIVEFNDDKAKTKAALEKLEGVQWVQPSNDFELLSSSNDVPTYLALDEVPNEVHNPVIPQSMNGEGVTIAIVDSAVDHTHPDLATAIALSDDFVVSGTKSQNGEAHGTAIAGVMVAQRDSKLGIAGVAPRAKLLAYRGCWESDDGQTNCNTLSLARALDAVTRSGADILNLSLSGPQDFLLDQLVNRVLENNTLIVAAFDPQRAGQARFPTKREGVLIVRAEQLDSQYQDVFTAPGARVVASPGNRYNFMKGHSVATAYTSGVLALHKQSKERALMSPINWNELSKISKATDLVRQIISESSQTSRTLLTNQYLLVSE